MTHSPHGPQAAPGYPHNPGYPQPPAPGHAPAPAPGAGFPAGPLAAGALPFPLASLGARLGARVIDGAILGAAVIVVALLTAFLQGMAGEAGPAATFIGVIGWLLIFVAVLIYEPVMTWRYGGPVGKRLCHLKVVAVADGKTLSFGRAIGRLWVTIPMALVPFLSLLDVLFPIWDAPYRQALHDKVVRSVVVKDDL